MAQSEASDVGMKLTPGVKIYLSVLGGVGLLLCVLGAVLDWPGIAYLAGGFLMVAGWGGLLTALFKVGWQPAVGPCPSCAHSLHFVTKKQYLRCEQCQAFLTVEGKTLATVSGQLTSDTPEYPVPFVRTATFPNLCMMCGQAPTMSEPVRFDHTKRKGGIPLGPQLLEITKITLQVPVCAHHAGQKAVKLDYGDHPSTQHDGVALKFRSLPALEAYRQHNLSVMPPIRNQAQMPHAPQA